MNQSVPPDSVQAIAVALETQHRQVVFPSKAGLQERLPGKGTRGRDPHLRHVLPQAIDIPPALRSLAHRQQVAADKHHVQNARRQKDNAQRSELEKAQRRETPVGQNAHGQNIGRRADQGHRTTQQR